MSYSVGESVSGTVSRVTDYGAFVLLPDGSTGMIHISKLSSGFVSDIHSIIKKGDTVTATVISYADNRIGLSLIGVPAQIRNIKKSGFSQKPTPKSNDFESMLSSFKSISDEKLAHITRGNSRDRKRRK